MTQTATFDDIREMFRETSRQFQKMVREDQERRAELVQKSRETDRKIQEIFAMFQETDRKFQETDRKFQETDRKFQETDRKFQETDRKFQETDRKFQETDRKLGRLGGRLGEFVEGLVAPACKTLFATRGIPVHKVSRRVEADRPGGRRMEIDLFVVNTDAVVLVEVKSKLTVDDVRDHLARMSDFKEFFPEYADKRAVGAVAGMIVEEHVSRFAIGQGLFVIEQTGDTLCLANDEAFEPRTW